MKKNNELVVPVLILGAGIGLYFLNKAGKLDKIKALFNKNNGVVNPVTTINPPSTNPPQTNPNVIIANPFTFAQLLDFQKWVNLTYKPTIPLVEDGLWGTNSAGAYNTYATAYANRVVVPPTPFVTIVPFTIGDKIYSNQDSPIKAYTDAQNSIFLKEFYKGELIGEIVFKTPFSNQYQIKKRNGSFYQPLPDTIFYVDSNKAYKK